MYTEFYGLTDKPFQLNPDPAFYYDSKQHRRASAYLDYGLHKHEGFVVVTGEVGAGKTTVVRGMLDSLDAERIFAAHLVSTQLDAEDTLQMIGAAFGLQTRGLSKAELLIALEELFKRTHSQGRRCMLIVDEAQNLSPRAVEELRMLSNFQCGNEALLQSILVGQIEFRQILESPQMMQFRQRVIAACHIAPLDLDDTRAYIEHRLRCAGSTGLPLIQPAAFSAIFKASGGIPRRINGLCDRLLLSGYLSEKTGFDAEDVAEVARELEAETAHGMVRSEPHPAAVDPAASGQAQAAHVVGPGDDPASLLAALNVQQFGERLRRLEYSLLQLEKISSASLDLLQRLVDDERHLPGGSPPIPPPVR